MNKLNWLTHYLDLERLNYGQHQQVNKHLNGIGGLELQNIHDTLTMKAHAYLIATGDWRHSNLSKGYQDAMFVLENDPEKMVKPLREIQFFVEKNPKADD